MKKKKDWYECWMKRERLLKLTKRGRKNPPMPREWVDELKTVILSLLCSLRTHAHTHITIKRKSFSLKKNQWNVLWASISHPVGENGLSISSASPQQGAPHRNRTGHRFTSATAFSNEFRLKGESLIKMAIRYNFFSSTSKPFVAKKQVFYLFMTVTCFFRPFAQ